MGLDIWHGTRKKNTMHSNQTGSFMFELSFICPLEYKLKWPDPSQNICQIQTFAKLHKSVQIIPRKVWYVSKLGVEEWLW